MVRGMNDVIEAPRNPLVIILFCAIIGIIGFAALIDGIQRRRAADQIQK